MCQLFVFHFLYKNSVDTEIQRWNKLDKLLAWYNNFDIIYHYNDDIYMHVSSL